MDIENVFSSRLRVKILKILAEVGELNVSEIARRLGVNYGTTNAHLKILEDEGLVLHKQFGRIRIYRLNQNSDRIKIIQSLFEIWKDQNK
jgi:DNA-binding transcriptional ArsR family regulator